jgi:uncharacterized protein YlzI (FlbEa/FlbD family)
MKWTLACLSAAFIEVTLLNGQRIFINRDLIESVYAVRKLTPDGAECHPPCTIIRFGSGKHLPIRQSVGQILHGGRRTDYR